MSLLTRWILSLEISDSFRLVPISEKYCFIWRSWDARFGEVEFKFFVVRLRSFV